jgi:hypothetical protein
MFWRKQKPRVFSPPHGKLEVISRHCFFSDISQHKKRFEGFSREKCHRNLMQTIDRDKANITFLDHFIRNENNIVEIQAGTEAGAFLQLLEYVESRSFAPETILYFVEDDYLHRTGWVDVLLEGMMLADYATLFDHRDKYFFPMYRTLKSEVFHTKSCHWRSVPSTTQTFAVRWKTLREDLSLHRKFSLGRQISQDHQKFVQLCKRGRRLISPLPGYSTHVEVEFASPCFDWEQIQESFI